MQEQKDQYVVLARKYRPQVFEDLLGQDALVQTLKNAIENNRLHHAYILTGIRGVGKLLLPYDKLICVHLGLKGLRRICPGSSVRSALHVEELLAPESACRCLYLILPGDKTPLQLYETGCIVDIDERCTTRSIDLGF